MRVAILAGTEFPSLSKTFILDHVVGLLRRGHAVDIFADYPENAPVAHPDIEAYDINQKTQYDRHFPPSYLLRVIDGCRRALVLLPQNPALVLSAINPLHHGRKTLSFRPFYRVAPYIGKAPYDIVHCHFGFSALKALELRNQGLLQGKLITTFHGADISRDLRDKGDHIYDNLFRHVDLCLPISELWQTKLTHLGCDPSKIHVHRMGIDCQSFRFLPRQLGPDDTVKLITVCRLAEKKGIEFAIRAVAQAISSTPNLTYDIIGDGPLRNDLQNLVHHLGLDQVVHLRGWQTKTAVIEHLDQAHIFLAPSITGQDGDQEGIPVAIMEAMAMGLPVISTLHSGIPELVTDQRCGLLVAERDVEGLAKAINYLVQNPDRWPDMGRAGRHQVTTQYDIETLNDQLVNLYQKVLAS